MSKKTLLQSGLLSGLLLLLAACASVNQQAPVNLFELQPALDRQHLRERVGTHPYLGTLLDEPSSEDIRLVDARPFQVTAHTKVLNVPLPDGRHVRFTRLRIDQSQPGRLGWIGDVSSDRKQRHASAAEIDMDPFNWISLLREADRVIGSVHVDGQAYRLESIGAGKHVLVKVDEAAMPGDEVLEEPTPASAPVSVSATPRAAHSTIRVLVVTTKQSRVKFPNYHMQVAQALQDANQVMLNSRVPITYELAGFHDAEYDETGRTHSQQLADVRSPSTDIGKAVHPVRDAMRADLVAMLSTVTNVCGLATVGSQKSTGFSLFSCMVALNHELGHNLGARHFWVPGDEIKDPPYAHGYRHQSAPLFHTIMATSHGAIPYFSNPRLQYQGQAIGTAERFDVARRFDERRTVVEGFYPPPVD